MWRSINVSLRRGWATAVRCDEPPDCTPVSRGAPSTPVPAPGAASTRTRAQETPVRIPGTSLAPVGEEAGDGGTLRTAPICAVVDPALSRSAAPHTPLSHAPCATGLWSENLHGRSALVAVESGRCHASRAGHGSSPGLAAAPGQAARAHCNRCRTLSSSSTRSTGASALLRADGHTPACGAPPQGGGPWSSPPRPRPGPSGSYPQAPTRLPLPSPSITSQVAAPPPTEGRGETARAQRAWRSPGSCEAVHRPQLCWLSSENWRPGAASCSTTLHGPGPPTAAWALLLAGPGACVYLPCSAPGPGWLRRSHSLTGLVSGCSGSGPQHDL
mmetsp:Transcript_56910/g.151947  ORF Transcript_56910/g.151947 Transcript_56910/m.151947 type:complete len:329 (+) Transcript_56910:378-1364(+)